MQKLASLETFDHERGLVHVVVETPKGGRSKVAFDPKLRAFVLKKEGRVFTPTGRHGPRKAMQHVEAGQRRYRRRK